MTDLTHIYQYLRSTDGVNQLQRSLAALDPYFVRMDERRKSDLIDFVVKLSEQIRYYDLNNQAKGNWRPFFEFPDTGSSIVTRAATVGSLPPLLYSNGTDGLGATITLLANGALPPQDGVALLNGDRLLVWKQSMAFQNGVYTVTQGTGTTPTQLRRSDGADQTAFLDRQIVEVMEGDQHARRFFTQEVAKPSIGASDITYLRRGLSRSDWSPHLALFMAFLQVHAIAQRDLNETTGRHLRYYYEDVLRLQRKAAQPDQVHVVFELAKNATAWRLPSGTLLDAGKSADGKTPRQYSLDHEMVVHAGTVQSLRSSYTEVNSAGKAIIFKAEDATLVVNDTATGWRPFGSSQLKRSPESRTMTEAKLGFGIASPALLLAEGERTITVTLNLQASTPATDPLGLSYAFEITLTGEKGWVTPLIHTVDYKPAASGLPPQLVITCSLPAKEAAVVAYSEALHGAGFKTQWPVLRCVVLPYAYQLEALGIYVVTSMDLVVDAKGVRNLVLQNDENVQPTGKPALPFGSQPSIQNNFYIGSAEVFSKSVQSLTLSLEWKDPPENFNDYYRGYDNPSIGYDVFIADMYVLAGRNWTYLSFARNFLFDGTATANVKNTVLSSANLVPVLQSSGFERNPDLGALPSFTPSTKQGFIKLVLDGPTTADLVNLPSYAPFEAFGHKSFPAIYAHKSVDLAKSVPNTVLPNQPYTPTLKSVTLDYTAKETCSWATPNGIDQFFVLDIFGNAEARSTDPARLVPEFPKQGALYIGLKNASFPQAFSFLFQMQKGDVPGAALLEKTDVSWSYVSGNHWQALPSEAVVEEATEIFQVPGIIGLTIGSASAGEGLLPADQQWIRATADQRADGAASVQEIVAQAARATRASNTTDVQTIDAATISRLVHKVPAVKSVLQKYPSFNGRQSERDANFFKRSSERLRHRNRGVVTWDYERLVMEAFPEVFKIKCLPHTDQDNTITPGHIKLVIVPDLRFRQGSDPLQPRSSLAFLRTIETFLTEKYLSSSVVPHAANPEYETLLVDCKVAFHAGFDPGFYAAQLQEDIRRFLSPWAYEEGRDIVFGGKVYKSEILAFIEGRPYVDYVVDFQLYHRYEGDGLPSGISCMTIGLDFIVGDEPVATIGSADGTIAGATIGVDFVIGDPVEVAVATRPDAILVSNPVHRIEVWDATSFQCQGVSTIGIGQMIVGLDFIPIS